ncbi:hypothetical protein STEG23_024304, partial [Scotinomys teguina]
MSAVMLLPGTNGSLLLVQRTVTRTIVLQETIGKEDYIYSFSYIEPSSHILDEAYFIILEDLFGVFLDSV